MSIEKGLNIGARISLRSSRRSMDRVYLWHFVVGIGVCGKCFAALSAKSYQAPMRNRMANPDLRAFRLALIASAFVSFSGCSIQEKSAAPRVSGIYAYEIGGRLGLVEQVAHQKPEGSSVESGEGVSSSISGVSAEEVEGLKGEGVVGKKVGKPVAFDVLLEEQSGDQGLEIKPGECWVYAQVQPRPVEESVIVNVRDSEVRLEVTPAEFRNGFKQVVTKEGMKTFRVKPATYKEVKERVLIKPETTRLVVEPAEYKQVEETVVLEPARTELEPCRTSGAAAYGASSAVLGFCAKEIPERTKTVMVTRLVKPETTRTEVIPAEYKVVTRKVVDQPAEVVPVKLDDEIDRFEVAELVEPAQARQMNVPAETLSVNVRRYEGGRPRIVARQAVCDRDLTRDMVRNIQSRLANLGYSSGEIDGLPGPRTIEALSKYQVENGLASGAITIESIESMGLSVK